MAFLTTLSSISIMGIMMLIGVLLRRQHALTEETQKMLVSLIVNVGMPCIILASIFNFKMDNSMIRLVFITFVVAVIFNGLAVLGALVIYRLRKFPQRKASEMAIVSGLGNTAFIGIPLCYILFGAKGALLAAVFDAGLDFIIWSLAVFLLQKESRFSFRSLKPMVNIPLIAIVIGLTLGFFQFEAPNILKQLATTLAGIASPLAMIYIGLLIPDLWKRLPTISQMHLPIPLIYKLIALPLITILVVSLIPFDPLLTNVLIVQMAMPSFTLASVLFQRYGADYQFGAAATIISIFLSIITLPLMVLIAGYFIS